MDMDEYMGMDEPPCMEEPMEATDDDFNKESDSTPEKELISKFGQNTSIKKLRENFFSDFDMSRREKRERKAYFTVFLIFSALYAICYYAGTTGNAGKNSYT